MTLDDLLAVSDNEDNLENAAKESERGASEVDEMTLDDFYLCRMTRAMLVQSLQSLQPQNLSRR